MPQVDARKLIDRKLYRVRGFLHPVDAMLFANLLSEQSARGVAGGVCEIGVFFGRGLLLMAAHLTGWQERALGIDLFDIGNGRQFACVKSMLTSHGVMEKCALLQASSLDLAPGDITAEVGRVRFFSVDGGHEKHHVDHDSALALASLSDEGIIAFDDFFNPLYPNVSVSVLDFLGKHPNDLAPFCISKSKLYVCRSQHHRLYLELSKSLKMWARVKSESFDFAGRSVVYFSQSMMNRVFYQKSAELGLGSIGNYLTRATPRRYAR
jgi:hypothetical protein